MLRHRVACAVLVCVGLPLVLSGCSTSDPAGSTAAARPARARPTATHPAHAAATPSPTTATPTRAPSGNEPSRATSSSTPTVHAAHPSSTALPIDEPTDGSQQVITVVASSHRSTSAVLQRWVREANTWRRVGDAVPADLGTDGMSRHPSESTSATPIGSFTLTQAFGHDSDPGTSLPYVRTTPSDWWISQPGPLYNTRQRCSSRCDFTLGNPNEHLYYETPAYDYAVVIDYNTRDAPGGVHQGKGSAFFLHVSQDRPTAGCVSIPVQSLLRVMRWLKTADHPRILIGTG